MHIKRFFSPIALLCLGIACSSPPDNSETVVTSHAALTATSQVSVANWTVSVTLPSWGNLGPLGQALTGTQSVSIGAAAKVQSPLTDIRRALIAAGGPINIQPDALIVGIVATGAVDLRDRAHVTGNIDCAAVTRGDNVTVDGKLKTSSIPVVGDTITWSAYAEAANVSGWDIQPGQSQSLAPDRYGALVVKNGATLTLNAAGRYFFESLDLETGSTLVLSSTEPTEIYVHGSQLILRGTLSGAPNLEEHLAIIYDGTDEVFLEAPQRGAVIAPAAKVTLRATTNPHRGAVFAKTVALDAGATLQPVAQTFLLGLSSLSEEKCSWSIPPRSTGNRRSDEFRFQYEILKYCIMRGYGDDELRLRGQLNYEVGEAAAAMSTCKIQPAQYLGFKRRRLEQLKAAVADPALAHRIVAGPDADSDWVPDSTDKCTGTSLSMPVDDNGCPMPLPPGPDCSSVKSIMSKMGMLFNPACDASVATMPDVDLATAIYMPAKPYEGVYLYMQDLPAQPVGCESWFELEIRTIKSNTVVDQFNVAFPYSSISRTGRFVPTIPQPYVQLHASPDASGNIGVLGKTAQALVSRTIDEVVFRVRAVSGIGTKGNWGRWTTPTARDCRSIGVSCGE